MHKNTTLVSLPRLLLITLGFVLLAAPQPTFAQSQCVRATQNKVAWDYKNSKKWAQGNLNRLCKGANNAAPSRCFQRVMHGKVNYGGGSKWKWENAIDLCEQSTNANQTINCFKGKIRAGLKWKQAIAKCDERAPKTGCKAVTQGKIAWDYKGSKKWAANNLNRLCKNVKNDQPSRCFQRVMHGKVSYGGGSKWKWENAIDLCEGSKNATKTIGCFTEQIKAGVSWKAAMPLCDERAPKITCQAATQNKIAWDYKGSKKWASGNLNRLCKNTKNAQAAKCFQRVMHGKINYGGGTKWKWENAIDLCERSINANHTIGCFQKHIGGGKNWKKAIASCGR